MDRILQPRVDQVSRGFANLQQNDAFDAQAGRALPRQARNRQRDQRCIRLQSTMPRPAWQTVSRCYLWRTSLR
ncbi:TPA: hypothetical protein ACH3X1_013116 [Trebouxia sp. C0004]